MRHLFLVRFLDEVYIIFKVRVVHERKT